MTISLLKLTLNPKQFHDRIIELCEKVDNLHQMAGPELRKLMDTYDFPFSTTNAILAFGQRLLKGVAILKETVAKFQELAEVHDPGGDDSRVSRSGDC